MIKCWTIRTILCTLVIHLTFLSGNAQDFNELLTWYIMKPGEVDKKVLHNHLRNILVYKKDSVGEKLVMKKVYDKDGLLVHRVDYSREDKPDSIETVIKRVSSNNTVLEFRFTGKGEYETDDEDRPRIILGEYFDSASGKYSILTKTYKRLPGKTIQVVTAFNGISKGISNFSLNDTVTQPAIYPPGDTTHIYDTLVVSIQEKDASGNLSAVRRSFIKGIADPVKTEYLRYANDSLAYHNVEINEYDKKKRLISHSAYQGSPLVRYEIKRTIYDDVTGEITETHGYNPVSGNPQRIWRYDKKGRILYFERPGITDMENGRIVFQRDKESVVYKYNKKGLLTEAIFSVNDVPTAYTLYKYGYY
jgi:hypothetical protein